MGRKFISPGKLTSLSWERHLGMVYFGGQYGGVGTDDAGVISTHAQLMHFNYFGERSLNLISFPIQYSTKRSWLSIDISIYAQFLFSFSHTKVLCIPFWNNREGIAKAIKTYSLWRIMGLVFNSWDWKWILWNVETATHSTHIFFSFICAKKKSSFSRFSSEIMLHFLRRNGLDQYHCWLCPRNFSMSSPGFFPSLGQICICTLTQMAFKYNQFSYPSQRPHPPFWKCFFFVPGLNLIFISTSHQFKSFLSSFLSLSHWTTHFTVFVLVLCLVL